MAAKRKLIFYDRKQKKSALWVKLSEFKQTSKNLITNQAYFINFYRNFTSVSKNKVYQLSLFGEVFNFSFLLQKKYVTNKHVIS